MADDRRIEAPTPGQGSGFVPPPTRRSLADELESRDRRHRKVVIARRAVIGGVAALVVIGSVVYLTSLTWTGIHQSAVALAILRIQIIGGMVPVVVNLLAGIAVLFLLIRRPTRGRIIAAGAGIGAGAIVAIAIVWILDATNALSVPLGTAATAWSIGGLAAIGLAIASFWTSRGWRIVGAAVSIVVVVVAATIGVDTDFGLDPTVGALAGVSTEKVLKLAQVDPTPTAASTPKLLAGGALWANWLPSGPMQAVGSVGQVDIPNTVSGFNARPAGLYLPPAALVANPPALPLVIMMMGQPGNPDPDFQETALDPLSARHNGLAPIVLVADQIGNPATDPLCLNTPNYGNAETYITQDVVGWARTHLHVLQDAAHWTIAGYSNGGECAVSFGAKYPAIWGNVLDISGEKYPGSQNPSATLAKVFHGDSAAYQATWPINLLAKDVYPDTVGIFTVSSNDYGYLQAAKDVNAAAQAAGWTTTYFEVPNGGHVLGALNGGLQEGYSILYPRLGLSQPGTVP
ncbi:MAG: alpha/beta hydrolase-fold protein [Actinomycetota bacterium]